MPREKPISSDDLSRPPIRRYAGPIIDAHTHVGHVETARLLFEVAGRFGVERLLGITRIEGIPALREAFPDRYRPILWVGHEGIGRPEAFARQRVRQVRQARRLGAVAGKFWYAPRFVAETHLVLDNPALGPVFETLEELGMAALVHVGDPDCWFERQYADAARFGTKAEHYEPLERVLASRPGLVVVGAHFGGDPEDLGHLRRLLRTYPNYFLDSSATKWIARELSVKPLESRAFVIEHADRIVFGSDLVAFEKAGPEDYASRYWVHRWLWEGRGMKRSPIPDPCVLWPDGPRVHGLDLPDGVLAKVYHDNACRVFGLEP
jgi:predicted TIM-barrel fold metal-dependent hydrolase